MQFNISISIFACLSFSILIWVWWQSLNLADFYRKHAALIFSTLGQWTWFKPNAMWINYDFLQLTERNCQLIGYRHKKLYINALEIYLNSEFWNCQYNKSCMIALTHSDYFLSVTGQSRKRSCRGLSRYLKGPFAKIGHVLSDRPLVVHIHIYRLQVFLFLCRKNQIKFVRYMPFSK